MTKLNAEIEAEKTIGVLSGWVIYTMPGRKFSHLPAESRRHVITNGLRGKKRWYVEAGNWPKAISQLRELFQQPTTFGNWIGHVGGYGDIGLWQCTRGAAVEALKGKAQWEGGPWTIRPANDTPEDRETLEWQSASGLYDVGGNPAKKKTQQKVVRDAAKH